MPESGKNYITEGYVYRDNFTDQVNLSSLKKEKKGQYSTALSKLYIQYTLQYIRVSSTSTQYMYMYVYTCVFIGITPDVFVRYFSPSVITWQE